MDQKTTPVSADITWVYGFDDVIRVQKAANDDLVSKYDNVVGTGVGVRMVDGKATNERTLLLFVKERVQEDGIIKLSLEDDAPDEIGGIPVDVIEVGDLVKHAGFTRRARPINPGFSISHGDVTAGTLGGLFLDQDGDLVVLSNNHVLANENRAKAGDPIYQPGVADMPPGYDMKFKGFAGDTRQLSYFATLKKYQTLETGGASNLHDSAIAVVAPEVVRDGLVSPLYPNGHPISGISAALPGMPVQKFGRTSGHTQGTILGLNAKFTIGYDIGEITFEGCIVATSMSKGGDSGSVLLDANMNAIGLLFAGSNKVSLFHPIGVVTQAYGLKQWQQGADDTPVAPEAYTMEFWGRKWVPVKRHDLVIVNPRGVLVVGAPANHHVYADTTVTSTVQEVSVDVFTGSDQGTVWGPGLAVTFPGGVLKLNVRYGDGFGASWDGREYVSKIKSSEPNRWYTLRLRITPDWVVADITDKTSKNGKWYKVVELPANNIEGRPLGVRVGKFDQRGGGSDGGDPGPDGRCQFANLSMA